MVLQRFFKRGPKMEPVVKEARAQLVQLIKQEKDAAQRQHRSISPEDLVPAAKQIITSEIAKWAGQSSWEAGYLVGYGLAKGITPTSTGRLPGVPIEDTDWYLAVVLATVESWLGRSGSNRVRWIVSAAGAHFHAALAGENVQAKRWADAEREFRQAIDFNRLKDEPDGQLVMLLEGLFKIVHFQGRRDESKKLLEEAHAEFARVPKSDASYSSAKKALDRMEDLSTVMPIVENPTAQDWFYRGIEHQQRGQRFKALLCWEESVALEPLDEDRREAMDNLRASLSPDEETAYSLLKQEIEMARQMHGDKARIAIFNLAGLLGNVKLSPDEKAAFDEWISGS